MDPQSAESSSGSDLHTSAPPRSSKEEPLQLRAAIQASLVGVDCIQIIESADIADSDILQPIVTDATESGSLHCPSELEELAQHETALNVQNEHNVNAEPDMPLGIEARMTIPHSERSDEHYIPWIGGIRKAGKVPRVLYMLLLISPLLSLPIILGLRSRSQPWPLLDHAGDDDFLEFDRFSLQPINFLLLYSFNIITGIFVWLATLLVLFVINQLSPDVFSGEGTLWAVGPSAGRMTCSTAIVVGASLTVLLSWVVVGRMPAGYILQSWPALSLPRSYSGCDARVSPDQSPLFTPEIYQNQFAGLLIWSDKSGERTDSLSQVDSEFYESVRTNATLCGYGFEANTDLYGLGFRVGVYFQWISSLVANHGLPAGNTLLQQAYLIFCLAICATTVIISVTHACVFSIEIELLYWLYWGGFLCVFASSPCPIRLGLRPRWVELDWILVVSFTMHTVMIYHAIWFTWYAYDWIFARMPCGTYHFVFAKFSDPSKYFSVVRGVLTLLFAPFTLPLLLVFPIIAVLLLSEVKHSVQTSILFQLVSRISERSETSTGESQSMVYDASTRRSRISRFYLHMKGGYHWVRKFLDFPSHGRGRIRLVTPVDVKHRRCVSLAGTEA